jgi:hypothetical protein
MSEDFFRISRGLEIDESIQLIQGSGSPGAGDSGNAQVGSAYLDNLNGDLWTKISVGTGIQHWSKVASETWVSNNVAGGVSWREPVAVINTVLTTLPTGPASNTIDGVTLVDGDRVLFAGLTPASPNIYIYDLANEEFVEDINSLSQGDTTYVDGGTSAGTRWTWNGTAWVRFDSSSLDELSYIRAYDGKPASGSIMPVYSSIEIITQGASLTTAISELDAELGGGVATGNFISAVDSLSENIQALDTELGPNVSNGNYILSADAINDNIQSIDTALGAPIPGGHPWISEAQHVNGNLIALADEIGANVSNGNWVLANNTVNQNIQALDTTIGAAVTSGSVIINTNSSNANIQLIDSEIGTLVNGNFVSTTGTIYSNIQALDDEIGPQVTDGTYVLSTNSINENVQAIDVALNEISKESTATNVTTSTVLDTVAATVCKWIVKAVDSANSGNVYAAEIFAASNGLTADFTRFAVLKLGSNIPGLQWSVGLSGANLQLTAQSTANVNITVRRVSSI